MAKGSANKPSRRQRKVDRARAGRARAHGLPFSEPAKPLASEGQPSGAEPSQRAPAARRRTGKSPSHEHAGDVAAGERLPAGAPIPLLSRIPPAGWIVGIALVILGTAAVVMECRGRPTDRISAEPLPEAASTATPISTVASAPANDDLGAQPDAKGESATDPALRGISNPLTLVPVPSVPGVAAPSPLPGMPAAAASAPAPRNEAPGLPAAPPVAPIPPQVAQPTVIPPVAPQLPGAQSPGAARSPGGRVTLVPVDPPQVPKAPSLPAPPRLPQVARPPAAPQSPAVPGAPRPPADPAASEPY